jgi:hypothetical protein
MYSEWRKGMEKVAWVCYLENVEKVLKAELVQVHNTLSIAMGWGTPVVGIRELRARRENLEIALGNVRRSISFERSQ